ncbi:hypothetical protein F511_17043 [Dorcoceras hygrometricum]|uniref:Uncharacterized protein n=1 Tax=Dorcoceras hygrometricum TaxID=472368 RepID=A0A2Z7BF11_9LAMI|nr:hypothetical protein F511_17043 [Dorcoceras hygrometricum]
MRREVKEMKRRRAEESADGLALMTSLVTSSYSADDLRPAVERGISSSRKIPAGSICFIPSWTTRRKHQQHPVESLYEPAVAMNTVASSTHPVASFGIQTQEKKKSAIEDILLVGDNQSAVAEVNRTVHQQRENESEASVTRDVCESVKYDDEFTGQLNHKGKNSIGYVKPENCKPSWLTNRLQKDKAKVVPKSSVPNQQRRGSTKAKSVWIKVQPKRDLNGQSTKPKLKKSHNNSE